MQMAVSLGYICSFFGFIINHFCCEDEPVESNNSLPLLTFFGKSVSIVDPVIIHLHYTEQTLSGSAQNEDKIVRIKYENEYKYI
jgi:hypothetical protein